MRDISLDAPRSPQAGTSGDQHHTVIHANEDVPSDIQYTSAATNDSFMLKPSQYALGDILAIDRAYIDYAKFEDHLCEHQEDKGQGQTHLTAYQ